MLWPYPWLPAKFLESASPTPNLPRGCVPKGMDTHWARGAADHGQLVWCLRECPLVTGKCRFWNPRDLGMRRDDWTVARGVPGSPRLRSRVCFLWWSEPSGTPEIWMQNFRLPLQPLGWSRHAPACILWPSPASLGACRLGPSLNATMGSYRPCAKLVFCRGRASRFFFPSRLLALRHGGFPCDSFDTSKTSLLASPEHHFGTVTSS